MVKIFHKTLKDKRLSEIEEFRIGSWIYAENPTEQELEILEKDYALDVDLLKDALDPHEVPRLELDKRNVYVFTRMPHQEKNGFISTTPVMIAVGPNFVLTVSLDSLPFLTKFIEGQIKFNTTQKTKLLLQIFSEINYSYNAFLNNISRNVRISSVQVENISNKEIVRFVTFESVLNDFLSALIPTSAILNNLLYGASSRRILELYEKDKDLIEDLLLNNTQLVELCKSNLKNIVNIREAYSTIMTNNLNRVIKFFTALTIIMTVPMIVSSFYGMNVNLPFSQSPFAFWGIFGSILLVSLGILAVFIKKKWL